MLDIAKIQAGRLDVIPARFNMSVLADPCANLATSLLKPTVILEKQVDETIGLIFTDQDKIKQIIINLLSKAPKFTHEGRSLLSVQRLDEPFNVDYIEQELADCHYQLTTAYNGRDALKKIHSLQPDLVLLDLMMPVLDGFVVLAQVKADSVLRDTPVIIISAAHDAQSVVKGIKQRAEDYLTKPVDGDLLLQKGKEYLG